MKRITRAVIGTIAAIAMGSLVSSCVTVEKRDLDKVGRASRELLFPSPPDEPRFVFERTFRGSADVTPESDEGALRRALTGVGSVENDPLRKPYAVAVFRGKILVTDSVGRSVRVFDVPGQRHYVIGDGDLDTSLRKPLGVDVDSNGEVFVADVTLRKVMVYDIDGKFLRSIGDKTMFDRISSVTVSPDAKRVYVVDIGGVGSENHRVRVFDSKTGKHLLDIGKRGFGDGELNLPRDVAIGKNGRVYVVDGGNFRVQVFDQEGKFIKAFGKAGKLPGDFARPKEIAIDPEGNVYVADSAFGNFQIFTEDGELLMFIGDRSEKDVPAGYMLPSGITVDEDGRVYFLDQWFARLDVYRPYRLKANEGYLGRRK